MKYLTTVAALAALFCIAGASAAAPGDPATLALLGKDFQIQGDWVVQGEFNRTVLFAPPTGQKHPAVVAIVVPRAGRYRLWVAAKDFPGDRPGTRTFSLSIAGRRIESVFGKSGKDNYEFEDGGWVELAAGPTLIALDNARPFARFHGLILSDDAKLVPVRAISATSYPAARLHEIELPLAHRAKLAELRIDGGEPQAVLANDRVRFEFVPAHRGEQATLAIAVKTRTADGWQAVDIDPAAEEYLAMQAPAAAKLAFSGPYPLWSRPTTAPIEVEVGGAKVATVPSRTRTVAEAGLATQFIPRSATLAGNQVRIEFHPAPAGQLTAVWELLPERTWANVELSLTPATDGQVSLGYGLFFRREPARVAELLLPVMYQRKRLPEFEVTPLSNITATPMSLVQPAGESPTTLALIADPRDIPFEWPDGRTAPYALGIRGPRGTVQPAIFAPVIGTPGAAATRGKPVRMRCAVLVQGGDWYAAFRTAVDRVFAVSDYRQNVRTSLSDAVLNMIDLFMDDEHGGWWERADAAYQIESKNGSTHAAPMLPLSLYRLTGDRGILERRALPTLGFMLSRDGAHFSPVPEAPGLYPSGSMNGPVKLFGTTTYAGLWELSARRTPALRQIADPAGQPKVTAGYTHGAPFAEYLARHQLTGDAKDLEKACEMADAYITSAITTPPQKDLGPQPFFFISFVPDWESLLRLYEVTGRQRYLDAAAFGARQLMTGLWSQPAIPAGDFTVHPTGQYGDHTGHDWWKGPATFRLGTPRKPNDTPAHAVPAWTVSNVGLGLEQPITYRTSANGRLIWQMGFSAHFLRLYRYTRDEAFLTSARNAVVGRWGNYPGYYITGFTDLPQSPSYPLTGPDVTEFYYHHIAPHLAWSIDYLVSEAEMLSDGAIAFPSLRQYGYAYFDSRIFGHAAGKVYDDPAAWLLLRRGVVSVDNVQINTLLAWSEGKLHIILANQSKQAQETTLAAGKGIGDGIGATARVGKAAPAAVQWDSASNSARLTVPARGLVTVTLSGVKVEPPARPQLPAERKSGAAIVALAADRIAARAAAIQVEPGNWNAYVWCNASPAQAKSATLHYQLDGQWRQLNKAEYPFEFLVPMADEKKALTLKIELRGADGKPIITPEATLRLAE